MPRCVDRSLRSRSAFDTDFRQLYHMTDDLHLSDKEYLLCLTIFFFSYAFFEVRPPSPPVEVHQVPTAF